jgi:hypothetical protein
MKSAACAFLTIAAAAWQLLTASEAPRDETAAQIDAALRAYRGLTLDLPADGRIGFIATTPNEVFNAANHFVAQYALAPRLVLRAFDPGQVTFVVTGVNSPANISGHPDLLGFELVAIRDFGICVFRKRNQ